MEVTYEIREAADLVTSTDANGNVNPDYPEELQPRDRTRSASLAQIVSIAGKLNPAQLGENPVTSDGAPIISKAGVVESGNGRTLALRYAYDESSERAAAYRAWLVEQGYDVAGMTAPVLVRVRQTEMTPAQMAAFTTDSNERTTLALSSGEQARSDARAMGDSIALFRGGQVIDAANREFVRSFIKNVVAVNDRGKMLDDDGLLAQDGRRRIEAAMLQAAYASDEIVESAFEDAASDIKGIAAALLDVAGAWAQMRREAANGLIAPTVDVTDHLVAAVNVVRRARAEERSISALVGQTDFFSGSMDPMTIAFLRVLYRGDDFKTARGRAKVADALAFFAQAARQTTPGQNLLGDAERTGAAILKETNDRILQKEAAGRDTTPGLFAGPKPDAGNPAASGGRGQRPGAGAAGEAAAGAQLGGDDAQAGGPALNSAPSGWGEIDAGPQVEHITPAALVALRDILRTLAGPQAALELTTDLNGMGGAAIGPLVRLAYQTGADRAAWTVPHEAIHTLRNLGKITEAEWSVLTEAAERNGWVERFDLEARYTKLYATRIGPAGMTSDGRTLEDLILEEAVAEALAQWINNLAPQPDGAVVRIFQKIRQFLNRLRNALIGRGFKDEASIFDAIARGDLGKRTPARNQRNVPLASARSAMNRRFGSNDVVDADTPTQDMPAWVGGREDELWAGVAAALNGDVDASAGGTASGRLARMARKVADAHGSILTRIFRDQPLPTNSTIENRAETRDVAAWERWLKTPERLFSRWPGLAKLVAYAMRTEQRMQVWRKRVTDRYETLRTTLRKEGGAWEKVAEALYTADADGVDLGDAAATRAFVDEQGLSPAETRALGGMHTLMMQLGRIVDQHRRAMLPTIQKRKAEVWRRMEEVLNSARVDSAGYAKKHRRRAHLDRRIRDGKGDLTAQAAERDSLTAELGAIRITDPGIKAKYDALRNEYDAAEARLAETSIRDRIKGYFPHKFYGSWRLYRLETTKDEEGNDVETRVEITSDQGFYDSRGEAIRAARAYVAENPGARLHIAPRKVSFPEMLSGTPVSDANHRRISEALAEEAGMSADEVRDAMKGVIRKRSRRRVLSAAMKRAGADGYAGAKDGTEAEMADRVIRTHIGQLIRYVAMDRLKAQYVNTTERMGLTPSRRTELAGEGRLNLLDALEAWWRDINGSKQGFEQQMDGALQRMGLRASTLAAAAAGAGIGSLASPYLAPVLAWYAGYRMYQAMSKGGEFPTRAVIGGVVGDMAHLKLGMGINIMAAAVNLGQTILNTYPLLGEKWTGVGIKRAGEALWSMSMNRDTPGRMSADAHILRRLDVVTDQRYTEENEIVGPALGAARRLSMFWFERAERVNRATAALGAYHRALSRGATPGGALEEARVLMTRTQFHQGAANRPELLRQQWARIPTQFQNYMYQQIAFVFGLRGKAEVGRFLLALFIMGGVVGFIGMQILDWLLGMFLENPPSLTLRLWAIDTAAQSGPGAMSAMQVLMRGFPTLAGIDISGRVGMGKGFGPSQPSDLSGPSIGSLVQLGRLSQRDAPLLEQLGAITPAANQLREIIGAVEGGPRTSGARRGYIEDRPTTGESARAALGARPLGRSLDQDLRDGQRETSEDRKKKLDRYLARMVRAQQEGQSERIGEIAAAARADGVTISPDTIRRALRDSQLDRPTRDLRRAPRDQRMEMYDRQRAVREFRGAEQ